MAKASVTKDDVVQFLRKRDYRVVKELGYGACGITMLLHDEEIGEFYVCKKYSPVPEQMRQELFSSFLREIKLLYQLHHRNVVRIFTHYLYASHHSGYILMEYIDGLAIDDYVAKHPTELPRVFEQVISGFEYLEQCGVLHRDIRPKNILVDSSGIVKIIDLGFGKAAKHSSDYDKSVSLNWWCAAPADFQSNRYDHCTEVYFVGMLMADLAAKHGGNTFRYSSILAKMCQLLPANRYSTFSQVIDAMHARDGDELSFSAEELEVYREFADAVTSRLRQVSCTTAYLRNSTELLAALTNVYSRCMLEEHVPDPNAVIRSFLTGEFYYNSRCRFDVRTLKRFIDLLRELPEPKRGIVLSNIFGRLDAIPKYSPEPDDQEVPF